MRNEVLILSIEKIGKSKDVWLACPSCQKTFYVDRMFWESPYDKLRLHCPYCGNDFNKEESPNAWGL